MESTTEKIRVSIVEDNHFVSHALESVILQSDSCTIANIFNSAEEALLHLCHTSPDVVLMDIDLGKISGINAVKLLKEKCPDVHFMICTVHEEDEKIFEALAAGASGYILKDTKPEDLIGAIKELANGGAPMSSKIARRVVSSFRAKEEEKNGNHLEGLTSREFELLELLVKGLLYKEIAVQLNIAQETVRKHVYNIYKKLHVNNRVEAYNKFYGN
jgi:DNA-binding NarL/FixJ family response regulator